MMRKVALLFIFTVHPFPDLYSFEHTLAYLQLQHPSLYYSKQNLLTERATLLTFPLFFQVVLLMNF